MSPKRVPPIFTVVAHAAALTLCLVTWAFNVALEDATAWTKPFGPTQVVMILLRIVVLFLATLAVLSLVSRRRTPGLQAILVLVLGAVLALQLGRTWRVTDWLLATAMHGSVALFLLVARRSARAQPAVELRPRSAVRVAVEVVIAGVLIGEGVGLVLAGTNRQPQQVRGTWSHPGAGTTSITRELPDAEGKVIPLVDGRSRFTVVTLWATWCLPCRRELPGLGSARDELEARGARLVLVCVDDARSAARAPAVLRELHVNLPCVYDAEGRAWKQVGELVGKQVVPTTIVLDSDGRPLSGWAGQLDRMELGAEVRRLVARNPPRAK